MWNFLTSVLNSDSLSPHGICLLWRPELIWLHVASDVLIGAAYFSIPIVLSVLVSRRPDIAFSWVFWAFAAFILACGTTHLFSIWTLFIPDYGLEGLVKIATALISVATAIGLWPLWPKALALPEAARTGAERAAVLTQRLLAFGRNHPHHVRKVDVNDFVRRSAEALDRTLGEKIQVELNLASDLWPTQIDPNELENALLNLALNARDAMPSGGRLTLATRNAEASDPAVAMAGLRGRFVEVAVIDQGEGMPAEVAEHAFEPFFTTKPVGTGSGLGLSQVYGFARQSRGAVLIDSAPGRGTAIRFYLPKWEPAAATEAASDFPAGISVIPAT